MSKQKRGMFRRMIDTARKAVGLPVTHKYADPAFRDPRTRKKKRASGVGSGRFTVERIKRFGVPPCRPGTITYQNKLVRHFGSRRAEGYRQCIIRGFLNRLPTEQDFADNPPWAYLQEPLWKTSKKDFCQRENK